MIVIDINGKVTERKYKGGISEIYDAIGADCFDIVRLRNGTVMFVDDKGLLKEGAMERVNWKATYLRLNQWMENPQDISWEMARRSLPPIIVGDVAILQTHDDGRESDLDDASRELILKLLGESVE